MSEPETTPKPESQVLFPAVEIDGIKLKPWSLGQTADLAPVFREMAAVFKREGISFTAIDKALAEVEPEAKEVKPEHVEMIFNLITLVLPYIPRMIAVTTGIKEADVREWDLNRSTAITVVVVTQNLEHIKNCFGLGIPALIRLKKTG
jgi:hypothetical protein